MSAPGPVTIRSDETKRSRTFRVAVTIDGTTHDVMLTVGASCQAVESEEHVLAAFALARTLLQRALEERGGEIR